MPVKHVTPDYPPTMLIHGTEDTDVPYEQSVMMAEQFKVHGQQDNSVSSVAGNYGLYNMLAGAREAEKAAEEAASR